MLNCPFSFLPFKFYRMKLWTVLISLFLFLEISAQHKSDSMADQAESKEKQDVLQTVRSLAELMIRKNVSEMEKILDEKYTLTHITGYVQPKDEWFKEVLSERMRYYSAKEVNYTVRINENKAEVIVQNLVDARIWGSRNIWRLQQVMKLERKEHKWIILSSVASTF